MQVLVEGDDLRVVGEQQRDDGERGSGDHGCGCGCTSAEGGADDRPGVGSPPGPQRKAGQLVEARDGQSEHNNQGRQNRALNDRGTRIRVDCAQRDPERQQAHHHDRDDLAQQSVMGLRDALARPSRQQHGNQREPEHGDGQRERSACPRQTRRRRGRGIDRHMDVGAVAEQPGVGREAPEARPVRREPVLGAPQDRERHEGNRQPDRHDDDGLERGKQR